MESLKNTLINIIKEETKRDSQGRFMQPSTPGPNRRNWSKRRKNKI